MLIFLDVTRVDKDHILLVDMNDEANQVFETLKEELLKSSHVKGVTAAGQRLGNNFHQWGFKLRTDSIVGLTPSNVIHSSTSILKNSTVPTSKWNR